MTLLDGTLSVVGIVLADGKHVPVIK